MIYILLAEGFEEIEALAPIDLLRRAGAAVKTLSVTGSLTVTGAHGVPVTADGTLGKASPDDAELIVLPGGNPGYVNLDQSEAVCDLIKKHAAAGKPIAAICGAPSILGRLGLLKGHDAVCYPGMEDMLTGARVSEAPVMESGDFITARGAGCAVEFGLALVRRMVSAEKAEELRRGIVCP